MWRMRCGLMAWRWLGSMIFSILLMMTLLTGCETQYQSAGLAGGYRQFVGPGHLQYVHFSGNGYSDASKIQIFALYRVAETAQAVRKPYFKIYDSLRNAANNSPSDLPRVGTLGNKPSAYAFVLYRDVAEDGAFETAAVLAKYEKQVKNVVQPSR